MIGHGVMVFMKELLVKQVLTPHNLQGDPGLRVRLSLHLALFDPIQPSHPSLTRPYVAVSLLQVLFFNVEI